MKLHLTVVHTAQPGSAPREFEFSTGPIAIGRSATGQIVIEGASISRVHITFWRGPAFSSTPRISTSKRSTFSPSNTVSP